VDTDLFIQLQNYPLQDIIIPSLIPNFKFGSKGVYNPVTPDAYPPQTWASGAICTQSRRDAISEDDSEAGQKLVAAQLQITRQLVYVNFGTL
jgi:hypothetical protein